MTSPFIILLLAISAVYAQSKGTYLGCWNDDFFGSSNAMGISNRDLKTQVTGINFLPSNCITECANRNFFYAGVQAGGECWCGSEKYGSFCASISEGNCNTACRGTSTPGPMTCGGENFFALYVAISGGPGQNQTCSCGNPGQCLLLKVSAKITSLGCSTASYSLSYSVNATGGVPPYLYKINNGPFTPNTMYNKLKQDNVTITVMDSLGNTNSTVFFVGPSTVVTVAPAPSLPYGFATTSVGSVDGYITLSAQAGQPPYIYAVYPKTATADAYKATSVSASVNTTISFLPAGVYTAIVTDANSCQSAPISITINTPVLPLPPTKINVTVDDYTDGNVPVTAVWTAAVNSGYAAIVGFTVQWGFWDGSNISWGSNTTVVSSSAKFLAYIMPTTRRFFRVATINTVGAGEYSAPFEFQSLCGAGQYNVKSNCTLCPAGTSTNGSIGRSVCRPCLSGTYSSAGSPACAMCTGNTYSSTAASSCSSCSAGYIAASSYCQPCNTGSYHPSVSSSKCQICPAMTYSSQLASTSCSKCPTGTTSTEGASYCVDGSGYK